MQPRLALSIGAVFYILVGVPLLLAPGQMFSALGVADVPSFALVPTRDSATLLIGVGIINWLARDTVGRPLRGLLWGNIFIRVAAIAVNGWELATGQFPSSAATVFPVVAAGNIALIIVFALALRRAYQS